jgi:DNA-binding response OmpR family regulator
VAKAVAKARAYRFAAWEFNVGPRPLRNPQGELVELSNGDFNLLAPFVLGAAAHAAARAAAAGVVAPERRRGLRPHDRRADLAAAQVDRTRNRSQPTLIVTQRGAGYLFEAGVEAVY